MSDTEKINLLRAYIGSHVCNSDYEFGNSCIACGKDMVYDEPFHADDCEYVRIMKLTAP